MSYVQSHSEQLIIFIRCIGLGVLLGLLYDAFSVLRSLLSDKMRAYVFCDIVFSLIATVISFFFMVLYNNGRVRFNLVAAQLMGGVAFHLSAGRHLIRPLSLAAEGIRKVLASFFGVFKKIGLAVKK